MRGGGKIVRFESKTADFLSCGLKIETLSHSLHTRYPEVANYPVRITNTGNQTDQIMLHLEKSSPTSEWMAELDETVFTLAPGQAAVTVLHVRRVTPMPTSQVLEADVIGESFNDAEVSCSLRTFTKIVEPYPSPQMDLDGYDMFLTEERPIEGKTVEIKAVIHNNGDQPAYNVAVTFFDQTANQVIGIVSVPQVAARSFAIVTAQWKIRSASLHVVEATAQYSGGTKQAATGITVKSCPQGSSSIMIDEDPPLIAYTGQPIYFDAFNFTDVDGNICECLWDFGDGSHASGPLILYGYWEDGVYTVTVRVIDDYGAETTKSTQLTILNRPPTVSLAVASSCAWINESVTFNASSSFDLDGNITQCVWDFGDGNLGNSMTAAHKYADPGIYNATLTVTDNDGASSSMHTQVTIVKKQALLGDLNGDGVVNIIDVAIVARAFGSRPGNERWNPVADLDNNGIINILDLTIVAKNYGRKI
jgi:PKD repeat protein